MIFPASWSQYPTHSISQTWVCRNHLRQTKHSIVNWPVFLIDCFDYLVNSTNQSTTAPKTHFITFSWNTQNSMEKSKNHTFVKAWKQPGAEILILLAARFALKFWPQAMSYLNLNKTTFLRFPWNFSQHSVERIWKSVFFGVVIDLLMFYTI